jgi:energy-coupling factor transporter ATP-binding protein EcfA2
MPFRVVSLPGPIVLVPSGKLDEQVRRLARDHPGLPVDPRQLVADLHARPDGVPATFSAPRGGGSGDWSVLLYGRTYVVRLFLTKKYQDAYTIAAINPLRIRDHHRLAQEGCLLLRPAGWHMVYDSRQIPQGADAHWPQLVAEWQQLTAGVAAQRGSPTLTASQGAFLDTLDQLIDATEKISTEQVTSERPYSYRDIGATGERRHGTRAFYEFHLTGGRAPEQGAFVQVRGEPEQRGQVTRVVGTAVTVRFDERIDWARIKPQGELVVTPSSVVYDRQRKAVDLLRSRQAHGPGLLPALVDHRVERIRPDATMPTEDLDDDQLEAFRKALAVRDMLLVIGPPGTGKTRTISQIARACAYEQGGRVLVTSHTNRAVDNVLARLPAELVAIRVGNEGSVTAEGRPYLLERQAADLRTEITNGTGRAMAGYAHLDVAARWAEELSGRIDTLTAIDGEHARAGAGLDVARRAAGGPLAARVDTLAAEHDKSERALTGSRRRIDRLTRMRHQAHIRAGWPLLLGALFGLLARLCERRLDAARADMTRLAETAVRTRGELAQAAFDLDAATRDDPAVRAARMAIEATVRRREEALAGARTAAHASRAAVSTIETPPAVRGEADSRATDPPTGDPGAADPRGADVRGVELRGGDRPAVDPRLPDPEAADPRAACRELVELRDWLNQRLPMFTARAKLLAEWHDEVSRATDQLYPELVRYADVIAATCIGAASRPELSAVDFDLAIVDEAGQIGVPDVLVPLVRARRGVLVGDHQQLPPYLDSEVDAWGASVGDPAIRGLLAKSALELLVDRLPDSHRVMLTRQRRMPAAIADFISASFYGGRLTTAVRREHHDLLFRSPLAFVDTARLPAPQRHEKSGRDRERWGRPGYTNPAEAELLTALAAYYQGQGTEWAVIVPYRAQVTEITRALTRLVGDATTVELNVGTVDSFQGGERDVILYGFTRSNRDGNVGFLRELRRANVAFTRAKHQLVLVGDMSTLTVARDDDFRELALALRGHLADHGDIRQYREIRDRLTTLTEQAGGDA